MSLKTLKSKGFTLIELMIVVAIIGILAAVAIPKFADLVTKSKEAAVKGNLGAVRSAISIYYGDMEGIQPGDVFQGLTAGGRYMPGAGGVASLGDFTTPAVTAMTNPGWGGRVTAAANVDTTGAPGTPTGAQYVHYNATTGDFFVGSAYKDTKGNQWTSY